MKKIGWILVGCGVVLCAAWLMSRHEGHQAQDAGVSTVDRDVSVEGSAAPVAKDTPPGMVSESVLKLIDPATDYPTRLDLMRKLGYEIPPRDVEAMMAFLAADIPADVQIPHGAYNSIRNDLYEVLLRQKKLPEGLGELLVGVVDNPDQDSTWRNYCIQFLPAFYERQARERAMETITTSSAVDSNEVQAVRDALWNALDERDNSNAGTALIGLDKLSRDHPEFDQEEVRAAMLELARDDTASTANRITALRLCGERDNADALDTARDLAENGSTTMLRCAAIATLGDLGSDADIELLQSYAASSDARISKIAQNSLDKLNSRSLPNEE